MLPILLLTLLGIPSAYLLTDCLTGPGSPSSLSLPTVMLSQATVEYLPAIFAMLPAALLLVLVVATISSTPLWYLQPLTTSRQLLPMAYRYY